MEEEIRDFNFQRNHIIINYIMPRKSKQLSPNHSDKINEIKTEDQVSHIHSITNFPNISTNSTENPKRKSRFEKSSVEDKEHMLDFVN